MNNKTLQKIAKLDDNDLKLVMNLIDSLAAKYESTESKPDPIPKKKKRGRGRPKGSKNKHKTQHTPTQKEQPSEPKPQRKRVKRKTNKNRGERRAQDTLNEKLQQKGKPCRTMPLNLVKDRPNHFLESEDFTKYKENQSYLGQTSARGNRQSFLEAECAGCGDEWEGIPVGLTFPRDGKTMFMCDKCSHQS